MVKQNDAPQLSETHYRMAIEAANIGMWDWDLLQNQQIWSKECKAILGVAPDIKESYPSFLSLIHPEDRQWVQEYLDETNRKHIPHHIVYRVIWPDGSIHWVSDGGKVFCDEAGKAIRFSGVIIDITARKRAEEALRTANRQLEEQQAFYHALLQQAPAGIIIAEAPSGKILSYNDEAIRINGLSRLASENSLDYTRFSVLHLDGTPYQTEEYPLVRAIRTGEVVKGEETLRRRDGGHLIYYSANAAPIYDASGRMLAGVVTFHNITERYALEQQKDEFICLASHELRTPLTSLKGNLQLVQRRLTRYLKDHVEGGLSQDDLNLFEQLLSWCERASRQAGVEEQLVNDLLDAASLRAEEFCVVLEPRDLQQVVLQAIEDLQTVAPPGLLVLATSVWTEMLAEVDAVRIGQVLSKYVTNALPYASELHPVTVGIDLEGGQARIWVQGIGPGLSEEQQQTIWKRFCPTPGFSGHRGMTCGGLGLSLYICERLIHLHRGTVGANCVPGKGSRFWFQLPLLEPGVCTVDTDSR